MELFFQENFILLILLTLWVLPWKGYALWSAVKLGHRWWFIVLLVTNTVAILDILYIFAVAKRGGALYRFFTGTKEKEAEKEDASTDPLPKLNQTTKVSTKPPFDDSNIIKP